jgi:hypothetical protein
MIASLLAYSIAAAPANAADVRAAAFGTGTGGVVAQPFLFGGATLRLGFDGRTAERPQFAMRLAGAARGPDLHLRIGEGLALSADGKAKPRITLDGQDGRLIGKRLGMSDGATAAVVIGGLVLVGGIVALAAGGIGDSAAAAFEDD